MSGLTQKLEAILFVSPEPLSEKELREALNISSRELKDALNELQAILEDENHGIFLHFLAGGWLLETKPEMSETLSVLKDTKRIHLSRAAIEAAAIIAYNQPVTRSDIDEIRGVRSDGVVARLLDNGLIKISGRRKNKNGAPLLYTVTQKFLEVFGLENIEDLPAIDEINSQEE